MAGSLLGLIDRHPEIFRGGHLQVEIVQLKIFPMPIAAISLSEFRYLKDILSSG
jgi:hypothetical protein